MANNTQTFLSCKSKKKSNKYFVPKSVLVAIRKQCKFSGYSHFKSLY